MKKLSYLIIAGFVTMLNAAEKNESVYPDAIAPKINFELINKSKGPIGLYLTYLERKGDYYTFDAKLEMLLSNPEKAGGVIFVIQPGYTFATQISLDNATDLRIAPMVMRDGKLVPSATELYTINAPGKTRYLSYNAEKKEGERLYPQTGPMKGLGKYTPNFIAKDITNTGLLKRNNIVLKDIARRVR